MNPSPSAAACGRLPHSVDIERAILGSILLDGESLRIVQDVLVDSDFFVGAHRKIYKAMQKLVVDGQPLELLTLCDALSNDTDVLTAGGYAYLAKLSEGVHRNAPVDHW